jgi:bacillopeptidase F (M6 metalloprotease family)
LPVVPAIAIAGHTILKKILLQIASSIPICKTTQEKYIKMIHYFKHEFKSMPTINSILQKILAF